jgi:hypothetical protein
MAESNETNARALTFGEKAAGINLNPSNNPEVDRIKRMAADFIDLCNDARESASSSSAKRYYSTAITGMEKAQMMAVKAATWQHKD